MKLPLDELIVFGPIFLLALVAGVNRLWLSFKYRHAP